MKSIISVFFSTFIFAAVAIAGTTGGVAPAVGKVNVPLTVPKVAGAECSTIASGRASTATVSVASTSMINWKAFTTADGAAVVVKRKFNSNSAYMPQSSEYNLPIESKASSVVFQRYSGNTALTVCVDKN